MKSNILKPVSLLLILTVGLMMTVTSCETEPEPMELPPSESLVLDLSQFPTNTTKGAELSIGNWLYSSLTVLGWNIVVAVNVAIPVTAYAEAFNHAPVYLGDNSWDWSYSVPVGQSTYDVSLIGTRLDNETFSMEMTLSQVGGFQNFKWFEGVVRYDHTEAEWILSHSPDNQTEYLKVNYKKDFETDIASIRYTVTDPANELYNAYIEFGLDPSYDLDAYYTVYKTTNTTSIEWSTTTKEGHVQDLAHFGDDNWHCWDGQLFDIDCPEE